MTPAELVKRSYYLAQVLDPREEIEGFQATEGLYELNRIISTWGSLSQYIPTYKELTISVLANTFSYNITPVITKISEANLLDQNNVLFSLVQIDLQRYSTLNFTLSAQSPTRPNQIFLKNDFDNYPTLSKVIFFPVPDTAYTSKLWVMQRLLEVTYSENFNTVPSYWLSAMEFELARRLISIYGTTPAITFPDEYKTIMRQLKAANIRDRSVQVQNEFRNIRRYRPWGVYVD